MKRSFVLSVVGVISAVGLTIGTVGITPAQAAPEPGGSLQFGACPQDVSSRYPALTCATMNLPLDYSNPDGEKIQLMVSKSAARNPAKRRGVLVINRGGPGGTGVDYAGAIAKRLPAAVADAYDVIGFDPRGVAHSTPIECVDPKKYWVAPFPDPDSPTARDALWAKAKEYADGCEAKAGKYLSHLTTPNVARDIDQIRVGLGEQKINYLGYSYGTYLGAVYGKLFPQNVDRMILDSSVNPDRSGVWYNDNLSQDYAVVQRRNQFYDWAAKYDGVFHLGTTREQVDAAWNTVLTDLRKGPHGVLGPWEFIGGTFSDMYSEAGWIPFAKGISDFVNKHDDKALISQVGDNTTDAAENSNAIYNAVECIDAPWPRNHHRWENDAKEIARTAPMGAWYNSWGVAPCADWRAPSVRPLKIDGAGLPPVLMFNSVNDPATPYEGALQMHESIPSSVFVTEKDAGKHGIFASAGLANNPAADAIGTAYLVDGRLPASDTSIPGHPLPDPTQPASRQAAAQSDHDLGR